MQPILVTGGAGFIGSCFVRRWLAERDAPLVNLDKLTYAGHRASLALWDQSPRHRFVHGDVADRPLLQQLLAEHRPQAIVHLAAETHVDRSIDGPAEFVQTNILGTYALLDAALTYYQSLMPAERARFRLVVVSTDEVYGSADPLAVPTGFDEQAPYAPNSPYAASKAAGDHLARAYWQTYGLPVIWTHCTNNYGPYQFPEKFIPLLLLNALERRKLPIYGDGRQVRDWLYVDDHVDALLAVLQRGQPGEKYHVCGATQRENLEVARELCNLVDRLSGAGAQPRTSLIEHVEDRPGHDRRYALNAQKIRRELDWQPKTSFDAGLAATAQWYLDHLDWVSLVADESESRRRRGLGAGGAAR